MVTAHTDVIGSQLRPPKLIETQRKLACGELTPTDFKRIEDRAVDGISIHRIVAWNGEDSDAVGHDDMLALPDDTETCLL